MKKTLSLKQVTFAFLQNKLTASSGIFFNFRIVYAPDCPVA